MSTKTLNIIQVLAKVGKILSKIVSICCIVGAVGCLVGIISVATCGFETFKIGGVTISSIIEKSAELSTGTLYASMAVGMTLCIGECIVAKLAEKYFRNELSAGTPFTVDGAKEMLRLGICIAAVSIGAIILADISYAVINKCFADVADMHIDNFTQVGTGLAFILASLLCRYGAEREQEIFIRDEKTEQ